MGKDLYELMPKNISTLSLNPCSFTLKGPLCLKGIINNNNVLNNLGFGFKKQNARNKIKTWFCPILHLDLLVHRL